MNIRRAAPIIISRWTRYTVLWYYNFLMVSFDILVKFFSPPPPICVYRIHPRTRPAHIIVIQIFNNVFWSNHGSTRKSCVYFRINTYRLLVHLPGTPSVVTSFEIDDDGFVFTSRISNWRQTFSTGYSYAYAAFAQYNSVFLLRS